ncbi:TATA box binding protein associated factor [Colletotrichum sublineola]|uniref:TBP-associated factor 6 n=1 Tax=Colletotrichum sublineola TaxID=1173701 RepID=A0A066WX49_COLSU|nr:TATA box binding protein associated factor [Colletotrichum sublineola]KDN61473.1 putative TATA box binding protein associated factor [Colletotrichum sublineola]
MAAQDTPKLLWNPDNVRDVAESVGITNLNEDALRCLTQDVEYRIGQVIVEALRFMRASRRTTLTVNDISTALKVLNVEPLYGYDSTRPLRYGEASLGPGQPLFYIEDEEVDFEKLINAPLPKVPRDMSFTAHWLAIEGVQPSIPQNPTTAESRSQELVPKGPGANPALAALAGNDSVSFRPAVKHVVSKELILYFEKVQNALLDDNPDEEVARLRQAALESVRDDPGLHQLIPYFINFVANQVTHRLDDVFTLRQAMELTAALIANTKLYLDPYANAIAAPVLTCILGRKIGGDDAAADAMREQYQLREFSASLLGQIARKYAASNNLLRPKLVRTCLKFFMDPDKPPATHFGAITGVAAAGGPEAVRVLVLKCLRAYHDNILQPLKDKGGGLEFEMLVGGILKAIATMVEDDRATVNGVNGTGAGNYAAQLNDFIGPILGERLNSLGNRRLIKHVLDARNIE